MFVKVEERASGAGRRPGAAPTAAEIDAVEARIAAVAGLLHATTAKLVELVAEVLASGAWEQAGVRSPAHWLAWQSGLSLGRSKRLVRIARRRADLPATTSAFGAGSLSEDQVNEIAAHIPAVRDEEVAAFAQHATVTQLRRVAREHSFEPRPVDGEPDPEPQPAPADRDDRNHVGFGFGDDGRWRLRADLDPELGALVQKGLEACRDAELHARRPEAGEDDRPTRITWTDALVRMADAALIGLAGDRPAGERHQVIVHVRLTDPGTPTWLHLGPALPAEVRRNITCDATIRFLLEDEHGVPLKLGRKQRTVTPQQRVVVEDRDKVCRRPGCTQSRWLHIHHLDHWEDGGHTDVDRMCALCPRDHDLHHRGLLRIAGDPTRPDGLTFTDHHGRVLRPCGRPEPPDPSRDLDHTGAELGIPPAAWQHPSGERLDPRWVSFGDVPAA